MRRHVLLAFALALSTAACASLPAAVPEVRVLVFNIHAGKDAAGRPNVERVAELVRRTAADFVLLQEVDRGTRRSGNEDQLQRLAELTGYSGAFGRSLEYDGGLYGVAALSRQMILSDRVEGLLLEPPQPRAGGSYEPRVAMTIVAPARFGLLQLLNTHLDASAAETNRLQESRRVVALVDKLRTSGLPVIAGGDFNAEPGSDTYRQLLAGGLRDAWTECGTGNGFTYPAAQPVKRIDYLFLTAGVICTAAEVIDTTISDHRPLLVSIRRAGAGQSSSISVPGN